MAATSTPSPFWLTDRTRSETGLGRCPRRRYLSTSFGPTGYGITSHSEHLPLATGLGVHDGFADLCQILARTDQLPTAEETRAIIQTAVDRYTALVDARGFLGILKGPKTDETIAEQRSLIAGLLWTLRLRFLPWLAQSYQVVSVEEERLHLLSCTCGAGPLDPDQHVARGCQGVALMLRRDLLARRRSQPSALAYFELKTTGWASDAWTEQWETRPQLALGTLDVDRQWPGSEVTELYIVGCHKGRRAKDRYKDLDPADEIKRQQSPLCYGYCKPGNPPLSTDEWLPAWEWVDDAGVSHRATRNHRRRGVWTLPESDWAGWTAYHRDDPVRTPEEIWVRSLPASVLDTICFLVGPMNRQDHQLASLERSILADEQRWQAAAWELYELSHDHAWDSEAYQAALDRLAPCAWTCRPFGTEHQCEFVPICHRHTGWQDPLATGRYVPRRPHHSPELAQAVARGLLVAETEVVEEEDDRG